MTVMDPFPIWDKPACDAIAASKGARDGVAKHIVKSMFEEKMAKLPPGYLDLMKAGVTTSLGYNFYDLRPPAMFLFPVNTPFRNAIPRIGRVNAGVGIAAHWKATRNPGTNIYVGVSEGKRNATATPDENDYMALFKQIGIERAVTFEAQFASEGYSDQLGDEQVACRS